MRSYTGLPSLLTTLAALACGLACDTPPATIYPLSRDPSDRQWDPRLLGTWIVPTDSPPSRIVLGRAGYYRYRLTIHTGDSARDFLAYLVPLNRTRFLDVEPTFTGSPEAELLQPLHFLYRIELWADTLWVGWVADTTWERHLRQIHAPAPRTPDHLMLVTLGTDSLRNVLHTLVDDSGTRWHYEPLTPDSTAQ